MVQVKLPSNMAVSTGQAEFVKYKFYPSKYPNWDAYKLAFSHDRVTVDLTTLCTGYP